MKKEEKYVCVTISGIITQIAKKTKVNGYTEALFEVFLPDEEQMTEEECDKWITENNNRMKAICKFLNDKQL